jgi:hypothetical protein
MNSLSAKISRKLVALLVLLFCVSQNVYGKQEHANSEAFFNNIVAAKIHPATNPARVLFVGNSFSFYNNGIHNHLGSLIRSAGEWKSNNRLRLSTLSGGHISEHSADLKDLLNNPSGKWQAIVLQGHSNEPIQPKKSLKFLEATTQAVQQIKAKGVQPILFMTWGYKGQAKMSFELADIYTKLANQLDVLVVPVGLAFAIAEAELSNIELFVPDVLGVDSSQKLTYRKDWKHPSEAGTYLAACVFYSALYQRTPEGLVFNGKLEQDTALALQKLSWQVTQRFYSKG